MALDSFFASPRPLNVVLCCWRIGQIDTSFRPRCRYRSDVTKLIFDRINHVVMGRACSSASITVLWAECRTPPPRCNFCGHVPYHMNGVFV